MFIFVFHIFENIIMIKSFFFKKAILLLLMLFPIIGQGNNNRSYCEELLEQSKKERIEGNYIKSIELLSEIKVLSINNDWTDLLTYALNIEGTIYMDLLDYQKAMECFLSGYEIAIKQSYKTQQIMILNNISQIYYINNETDKAKEYLDKAYEISEQLQDSAKLGIVSMNLGVVFNKTGDLNQAEKYLDIAIKLSSKVKDTITWIASKVIKIENLYLKKEYDKAESLALEILEETQSEMDDDQNAQCLLLLSQIHDQKKNYPKAISYAREALNNHVKLTLKIEIYEQLSKLYRSNNALILALDYQDSLSIAKDSLMKINDMAQVANNQIRFDLINSEKELAENKAKQKTERTFFIFVVIFMIILSIIAIWIYRIKLEKNKQQKIIAENEQKIIKLKLEKEQNERLLLEQQLKEQETLSLLEQEKLNNEIDTKNRQLASKALFQSNRNELIKEIIDTFSNIVSNKVKNDVLESAIQQLRLQLKESAEWDGFLVYFEKINPLFLSSLKEKHPTLNASEIRFLSYIYLNLDTKEIAKLLNITPGHCRKKRLRLANKMHVSIAELYSYLINEIDSN